jgi:hypothetical protein
VSLAGELSLQLNCDTEVPCADVSRKHSVSPKLKSHCKALVSDCVNAKEDSQFPEIVACSQCNCETSVEVSYNCVSDLLEDSYFMEIVACSQCNCETSLKLSEMIYTD